MLKNLTINRREAARIAEVIGKQDVVLYGAGKYGRQALQNIKSYYPALNVKYFIDDNLIRNNKEVNGIEVISLSEAVQRLGKEFYILITNYYVSDVLKKIEENNYDISRVYFCNEFLIEDIDYNYIESNKQRIQDVYNMLKDYKSKIIYKTMIESRFTKNIDLLSETCDKNQYFPEEILEFGKEEVFVDAGAYDGDTVEQFLSLTNQKYKYIYAFEPDRTNYERLREKNYNDNIKIFNAGLYNVSQELCFSANKGGSSKIEDEGSDRIQVYKFDELEIPNKEVTFVKMDIEGSELKALQGMEQTIIKYKPKMAICIYHKFEDIWELPLYIKSLVPEYKIYIRNYTTYLDEIVLYATL